MARHEREDSYSLPGMMDHRPQSARFPRISAPPEPDPFPDLDFSEDLTRELAPPGQPARAGEPAGITRAAAPWGTSVETLPTSRHESPDRSADAVRPSPYVSPAAIVPPDEEATGAKDAPADPPVGPGTILRHRYQLDSQIGSGGSALVFRATDLHRLNAGSPDPYVAVKVLRPELRAVPGSEARLKGEFVRIEALAHPNITRALDLDRDGNVWFLVLELLEGTSLATRLNRQGSIPLPRREALGIIKACGNALAFAHELGHLHLDFKPGNVFLTQGGEVRILDLGAGQDEYTTASRHADPVPRQATPAYASPEMLAGDTPDVRDDIFSFALLIYELLTGKRPDPLQPGGQIARPDSITRLQWTRLQQALSKRRADRPTSALELGTVFQEPSATRRYLPLIGAACVVMTGFLYFALNGPDPEPQSARSITAPGPMALPNYGVFGPEEVFLFDEVPAVVPNDELQQDEQVPDASRAPPVVRPAPPQPVLIVPDQTAIIVNRSTSAAAIILQRESGPVRRARIEWKTEPGSALPGVDFETVDDGALVFADNQRASTIYVKLLPGSGQAGDRTFYVDLSSATRGVEIGGGTSRIPVTIRDQ